MECRRVGVERERGRKMLDAGLVDGGRRHQPRNAGGLSKLEKARKQLLP